MKRSHLLVFILCGLLTMLLSSSCKKDKSESSGFDAEAQRSYEAVMALQTQSMQVFDSFLATQDTAAAKVSLAAWFKTDATVEWTKVSSQGVMVKYTNGICGGLILDFERKKGGLKSLKLAGPENALNTNPFKKLPSKKKAIILAAFYDEFATEVDDERANWGPDFALDGITNEAYLTRLVTLNTLSELTGWGVIDFNTHGIAWPDKVNTEEVFMFTREYISNGTTKKYWDDVKQGFIGAFTLKKDNSTIYAIKPAFITKHNDFSKDTVLFYGGFCYSALGTWPKLVNSCAAGTYFGFNWSVLSDKCALWAIDLIHNLSDHSRENPMTVEEWMSTTSIPKEYFDKDDKKTVKILYEGYGGLTLWSQVKIDSLSPGRGTIGTAFYIYGKGFGNTQSTSTVTFGTGTAGASAWTDTRITTSVPAGAVSSKVFVTVDGKKSNSVLFTINGPEISAIIPDSAMVGETVKINGKNFGSNLSALKVFFGNIQATEITNLSNTSLDVKVPAGAASGNVVVQVGDGTSNGKYFKVISLKPVLNSIKPFSALPRNRIELYGTWPTNDNNPANSYISIDGNNYQLMNGSSSWTNEKLYVDIPQNTTTGNKLISLVYKGVESNKVNYLIGIPFDSIRKQGDQLRADFSFCIERKNADQTTDLWGKVSGGNWDYAVTNWNGYDFTATFVYGTSTSKFSGTISNDGAKITSLSMEYTQPDFSHIICTLKSGESISLDENYALNYASRLIEGKPFQAPDYFIEETEMENKFTVTGNLGTATAIRVYGIVPSSDYGRSSILNLRFE